MDLTRAILAALCLTVFGAPGALAAAPDPYAAAHLSDPADLNLDGSVNSADLALILGDYGVHHYGGTDLNLDGVVDSADMAIVLGAWTRLPIISAMHITGDAERWRLYVSSVVKVERSPFRSDWTRIWALDLETGQLLGFDVDVYLSGTEGVLYDRQWTGTRASY